MEQNLEHPCLNLIQRDLNKTLSIPSKRENFLHNQLMGHEYEMMLASLYWY